MNIPEYVSIAPNRARRQNVMPREEPKQLSFDKRYDDYMKIKRAQIKKDNPNFRPVPASYDPNNNFTHYKYLRPTRFTQTQTNHGIEPNHNDLQFENMDLMTQDEKDDKKVNTEMSGQKMSIHRPPKKLLR